MSDKRIDINVPILARVEGEGALEFRIEDNRISDLKLRIYEPPRYFEKFLEGRTHQDVIDIVARICGICPVAYQMSAVQAIESVFGHTPCPWLRDVRRLMYCGEWLQSHSLHIHMLAAPDFLGFNSVVEMAQEHSTAVQRGLRLQKLGNDIIAVFGGRSVHPVSVCAGGFSAFADEQKRMALLPRLIAAQQDAEELVFWVSAFDLSQDDQDFVSVSLRGSDDYPINDGVLIADNGLQINIDEFEQHFVETQVPHSTALHCLLHGEPYLVGPLARMNNNVDRLPDETQKLIDKSNIRFPSTNMFHSIVARALEIHFVIGEAIRLLQQYQQPSRSVEPIEARAGVGFGCTEAPRGILWHRYEFDDQGCVRTARIVPPTSQNQARIEQDIQNALIRFGLDKPDSQLQLHAEKVIRNYDPCISCATHFLKLRVERGHKTAQEHEEKVKLQTGEPVRVLAIGSPLSPDNISFRLVDRLNDALSERAFEIIKLDRPGTDLLNYLDANAVTYIVDAILADKPKTELLAFEAAQLPRNKTYLSSHDLQLVDALALADSLSVSLTNVVIVAVPVTENETISTAKLDEFATRLLALIQHG